jgi:hypothetical protein
LVQQVGFITWKFVTLHGHMNVKTFACVFFLSSSPDIVAHLLPGLIKILGMYIDNYVAALKNSAILASSTISDEPWQYRYYNLLDTS